MKGVKNVETVGAVTVPTIKDFGRAPKSVAPEVISGVMKNTGTSKSSQPNSRSTGTVVTPTTKK